MAFVIMFKETSTAMFSGKLSNAAFWRKIITASLSQVQLVKVFIKQKRKGIACLLWHI